MVAGLWSEFCTKGATQALGQGGREPCSRPPPTAHPHVSHGADTEPILPLHSRGEPETGGGETKTLLLLNFSGVHQPVASGEPMHLRL